MSSALNCLSAGGGLSVELEDGKADYMGNDVFVVSQQDGTAGGTYQRVVLTKADLEAMLAVE